ncbi:formimidoylglutamate deiminase [Agrobacterium rhizogenes]|uniref:formimidoylglutamate deiminase n=1 Tax=Rhizobium rhizogenes TaxID=359 RepID=UPI0015739B2F|nr:formimidoylglutamate deiminase [Rhizobium rhizogenes]NTF91517.1 formimidoylglutamate deiminase [Rhizobium rhizogenes]
MKSIYAAKALLPSGWAENVELTIDAGRIAAVSTNVARPMPEGEAHAILLPAMPNLHSHAFQRAMAGLTELRGPGEDSFWSWRTLMYRFALSMSPEQVEAVAAQLYMEMLEAGFGRVGEFHYLHHDRDGSPYANIAEMAERVSSAAAETGIAITLLPVFYAHSNFGGKDPNEGQRRFITSADRFAQLMDACRTIAAGQPGMRLGIAPHSLRAATPDELTTILPLAAGGPIHIHVAEQTKEVDDCLAWSGARPVEWLLDKMPVDDSWCLIHATHLTEGETRDMATRGAIAGLCPITEANLGDGIFPAPTFLANGGRFGIGSDSNVRIDLGEELRQLEYSQRLAQRARNVIARPGGSTGLNLFENAVEGGNAALSGDAGLVRGGAADFVSLSLADHPWLTQTNALDHLIFAGSPRPDCVWVNGIKQVIGGQHRARARIKARFTNVMKDLVSEM